MKRITSEELLKECSDYTPESIVFSDTDVGRIVSRVNLIASNAPVVTFIVTVYERRAVKETVEFSSLPKAAEYLLG